MVQQKISLKDSINILKYIERSKTVYINNALRNHGYSAFSITIIEIIDIKNLSLKEARDKILAREQYYLDILFSVNNPNTYYIIKKAGSSIGYKHSPESRALISQSHSTETRNLMSRPKSASTKALISKAKVGSLNSMSKKLFIYSFDLVSKEYILDKSFDSCTDAAKFFKCSNSTITKYLDLI